MFYIIAYTSYQNFFYLSQTTADKIFVGVVYWYFLMRLSIFSWPLGFFTQEFVVLSTILIFVYLLKKLTYRNFIFITLILCCTYYKCSLPSAACLFTFNGVCAWMCGCVSYRIFLMWSNLSVFPFAVSALCKWLRKYFSMLRSLRYGPNTLKKFLICFSDLIL